MADRDDLVASAQAEPLEDAHQGDGPIADGDRMPGPDERRETFLNLGDSASRGGHAALKPLGHATDPLRTDIRAAERAHAPISYAAESTCSAIGPFDGSRRNCRSQSGQRNDPSSISVSFAPHMQTQPMTRAGFPTTSAWAGTSRVTTAP